MAVNKDEVRLGLLLSSEVSLAHMKGDVSSCDVILVSADREFHAHRLILCAASSYFNSVLLCESDKNQGNRLLLPDPVTPEALNIVLEFIYCSQTTDAVHDINLLRSVVATCHFFKLNELFMYYVHYLAEDFSRNSVDELLRLATEYNDAVSSVDIVSHLSSKFCHLYKRQDFLNVKIVQLVQLLENVNIDEIHVVHIRQALVAWRGFEASRKKDLIQIASVGSLKHSSHELRVALGLLEKGNNELQEEPAFQSPNADSEVKLWDENEKECLQKLICFYHDNGQELVRIYDVEKDVWLAPESLPFNLMHGSSVAEFDKHIYFLGGSTSTRTGGSAEVIVYCPSTNTSVYRGGLCFPVVCASATLFDGYIYLAGGKDWLNHLMPSSRVQRYDPATGKSQELAKTYMKNCNSKLFVSHNTLYIVNLGEQPPCVECYNPSGNQWSIVRDFNHGFSWNLLLSSLIDQKLYFTVQPARSLFHVYDPSDDKWSIVEYDGRTKIVHEMWPIIMDGRPVLLAYTESSKFQAFDIETRRWEKRLSNTKYLQTTGNSIIISISLTYQHQQRPTNNVMMSLNAMRTFSTYTDITLNCRGNRQLQAHRLVLFASSPYFHSMFSTGLQEAQTGIVDLQTISYQVMNRALEFLYTGTIKESEMQCQFLIDLLSAAHLMMLHKLVHFCLLKLSTQLNIDNFMECFYLAELYSSSFASRIVTFVVRNFTALIQNLNFEEMDASLLKRVLFHPEFQTTSSIEALWKEAISSFVGDMQLSVLFEHALSTTHLRHLSTDTLKRISGHPRIQGERKVFWMIEKEVRRRTAMRIGEVTPNQKKILYVGFDIRSSGYLVSCYDLNVGEWKVYKFPIQLPLGVAAATFGNYVYLFGGEIDGVPEPIAKVYRYCPSENVASIVCTLQFGIKNASAGILDDAIYVLGGMNSKLESVNSVQRFLPSLGACDSVSPSKECYVTPNVFSFRDSLYVASSLSSERNIVECYNSLLDQWTMVTQIPATFHQCMTVTCGENLYLMTQGDGAKSMYVYQFSTDDWEYLFGINNGTVENVCALISDEKKYHPFINVTDFHCNRLYNFYESVNLSNFIIRKKGHSIRNENTFHLQLPKYN